MQPVSLADAQGLPSAAGTQAAADATALDRYVGYYQLNPRAVFTITRTDDQLFAQLTGQRVLPLRAAGNGEYVYGSAALRMSFVSDGQGTMLVLRQRGQNLVSTPVDEARAAAVESVFVRQIAEAPTASASSRRHQAAERRYFGASKSCNAARRTTNG